MATYKVVLDKRRKKNDGSYCVLVRITENRRINTITSGINIEDSYWDENLCKVKSTHPNYQLLNQSITEWYLKIQKAILQLEGEDEFTFEALKERLANNGKPRTIKKENYFNDFAKQLIDDMFDANQTGNATIYKTSVNRLLGFINHRKLKFIELDYVLLESFRISLTKEGVKPNSISNYFRTLRAIYNRAIKAKLIDQSHYPFRDVVIKTEKTAKRAIRTDDFKRSLIQVLNSSTLLSVQETMACYVLL